MRLLFNNLLGYVMDKLKDWIIIHVAEEIKFLTGVIMLFTAFFMVYDKTVDANILPNYFEFSQFDWWAWLAVLASFGVSNIIGILLVDCFKARLIFDLVLQISGLILLVIGWAFIAKYPPFSHLMLFYPAWGIGIIIAGRHMGKRSRKRLAEFMKG